MALLSTAQEAKVRQAMHRAYSAAELPIPWTKPIGDGAIAACDTWINSNAASYNTALPSDYKAGATAADKAILFMAVGAAQHLVDSPEHLGVLQQIITELSGIEGE